MSTARRRFTLPPAIAWHGELDGTLRLLDQTRLPQTIAVLELRDLDGIADAILRLCVRGAPAIGVAAAYGVVLGVRQAASSGQPFLATVAAVTERLAETRPTAVNLPWALERMLLCAHATPTLAALLQEARAIHREDQANCTAMGQNGADLVREGCTVLTHCNTGRLATAGDGTALAVLFAAFAAGRNFRVLCDETRPLLQGARLTALELHAEGIPTEVIADGAAAGLIARGQVDLILTGADRIAANGDAANKVGTYGLALAAAAHGVPMYIVAPASTFDLSLPDGSAIVIEERDPQEVLCLHGQRIAPDGVPARNPAFDITPGRLLAGLVTDRGLIRPVSAATIKTTLRTGR